MPSSSPREALLLELEGRLLEEAGASDEASSDLSAAELAWELELDECDELDAGRLLELLLDEGRLLLELSVSSLDELPEEAWLLEEGRLLLPAPEAEELLPELEEEADASSEGASGVLDAPEELPEELEELPEEIGRASCRERV